MRNIKEDERLTRRNLPPCDFTHPVLIAIRDRYMCVDIHIVCTSAEELLGYYAQYGFRVLVSGSN